MKVGARKYALGARGEAMEQNRQRILDAALQAFLQRYYDEVTLESVAAQAGVSLPTVMRHFGSKGLLLRAVWEREMPRVRERREVAVGDAQGAARALVADYEIGGLATIRGLALEERLPELKAVLAEGRRAHREWVERTLVPASAALTRAGRLRRIAQLVLATDVYAWKLWRVDMALSARETTAVMQGAIEALMRAEEGAE